MAAEAAALAAVAPTARQVRLARAIGWSAWIAGGLLRVAQVLLAARIPSEGTFVAWGVGLPSMGSAAIFGSIQATVGAIIVGQRPRNVIGWLFVATALLQGVLGAASSWTSLALAHGPDDLAVAVSTIASVGVQAAPLALITIVLLIYPDGRFLTPRWRWVLLPAVIGFVLRAAEVTWGPSDLFLLPRVSNPFHPPIELAGAIEVLYRYGVGYRILEVAVTLASISLWFRYRRSDRVGRLQLRWFFVAAIELGVAALPFAYVNIAVPRTDPSAEWTLALLFLAFSLPSIAVLVAITRYRLFEIDRIVNRTILYTSLTAILAGIFTAGIALAQRLFVLITNERSDAAIVLTTFVVATAYAPLRRWLESVVDRHFKFEHGRFGAFHDEVVRVLAVIDPVRAGGRLCREAVTELEAIGAAVVGADERPLASAGAWPVPAAVRIPIRRTADGDVALVVGPRRDGTPHDPVIVDELGDLARLVGRAAMARG